MAGSANNRRVTFGAPSAAIRHTGETISQIQANGGTGVMFYEDTVPTNRKQRRVMKSLRRSGQLPPAE